MCGKKLLWLCDAATGCPGPIFEISIANKFLLVVVRPKVPLSKKCLYGGTFCSKHNKKIAKFLPQLWVRNYFFSRFSKYALTKTFHHKDTFCSKVLWV